MLNDAKMLLDASPYGVTREQKRPELARTLAALSLHHQQHCAGYQRLLAAQWPELNLTLPVTLESLPYLSVRLFKELSLKSIADDAVFKTLYSSGTTGTPSRIALDAETAALQSKILVKIMQQWLGRQRLPMLILDHPGVIKDRRSFSARGAGIQGLSFMGRHHCYALHDDMTINDAAIAEFCQRFADQPVFLFGFTFMVWQYVVTALQRKGLHYALPQGILLHSGGWKKLADQAVDNATFKAGVAETLGISRVHNFYGMVEQVGAIFVECEHGHLHCPCYADVLVREPGSWSPLPAGEPGVLQLLSTLPHSYPGHSLLTEDRGVWLGEDDCPCGRKGRYFNVLGRLPQAEVRGCSDTFSEGSSA